MMKITVIVPTYKPGGYIYECIDSLRKQSLSKELYEVIIVLNGCTEPYFTDIKDYVKNDYNFKLIKTDIAGVSNARNIGLSMSNGEYICFIDDDDYVSNNYLLGLLEKSSKNTVVLSNTIAFFDKYHNAIRYPISEVYKEYENKANLKISSKIRRYFSGPCMKLIPKVIIGDRCFNTKFKNGEDSIFIFEISDKIEKIEFSSEDAIYYRRFREGSAAMSKKTFMYALKNSFRAIGVYVFIYLKNPTKYNFLFFISRLLGAGRYLFYH